MPGSPFGPDSSRPCPPEHLPGKGALAQEQKAGP